MDSENIRVLMLPWLAHGHISPYLELAKSLSSRNFHVYFCSTPINLISIRENKNFTNSSIQFLDLNLPSSPELPPQYHTTNGLPPHLMPTLKEAFDAASPSFNAILDAVKPDLLIYDFLQPWAPKEALWRNIPSVLFLTTGATFTSHYIKLHKNPSLELPSSTIFTRVYEKPNKQNQDDPDDVIRILECFDLSYKMILIKTSRPIEEKCIDYLSAVLEKKMVPVGPLVQEPNLEDHEKKEIMEWIDTKEDCSTVFASFGSEYFLSKEDIEEIAHGLELSNVNFIWVVRFPQGEETRVEDAMPLGFLERVRGRGLVVEGWAPQVKMLGHASVGGFLSHCGWSSVMEGIVLGVPIIALPMHLDQPLNARLVEEVGVGLEVERGQNGKTRREEVARVIKEVLRGKSGETIRRKTVELCNEMKNNGREEMNLVVKELTQLSKLGKL